VVVYTAALATQRELGQPNWASEAQAGLARVAVVGDDLAQALNHVEDILAYLAGTGSVDGTEEPLRVHLTCYQVLQAAGDPRATKVLETAHATLQQRAAKIPDEAMRRSFLENVPYHREIVAAWAAYVQANAPTPE
jgi:hypothetical protein